MKNDNKWTLLGASFALIILTTFFNLSFEKSFNWKFAIFMFTFLIVFNIFTSKVIGFLVFKNKKVNKEANDTYQLLKNNDVNLSLIKKRILEENNEDIEQKINRLIEWDNKCKGELIYAEIKKNLCDKTIKQLLSHNNCTLRTRYKVLKSSREYNSIEGFEYLIESYETREIINKKFGIFEWIMTASSIITFVGSLIGANLLMSTIQSKIVLMLTIAIFEIFSFLDDFGNEKRFHIDYYKYYMDLITKYEKCEEEKNQVEDEVK